MTWSSEPAGYDFVALYAAARLVATGAAASVTDADALLAMEHATLPERTILLNDPNPPALALLMAPVGALPLATAYAIWAALGAVALAAAAYLLGSLAELAQHLAAHGDLADVVERRSEAQAGEALLVPAEPPCDRFREGGHPFAVPLRLVALFERRRAIGLVATSAAVALVSLATVGFAGMARYPDLLTRIATELRPGELGLAALVRRVVGGDDIVLNATLAVVLYALAAVAVLVRSRMFATRVIDASTWSILAAPHALLHDGVMAYPAVARAAITTRSTVLWVGSGIAVALIQQAGIPLAPLWLLALWWFSGRR